MWWTWVTLGIGAVSAIELALDRNHRAEVRAAHLRSREAMRTLNRSERREVGRAMRQGRAVADPRLAPAAVALAAASVGGRQPSWRWASSIVVVLWFTVPAVVTWAEHRWLLAAGLSITPLFFLALFAFGFAVSRRAAASLDANRRLADQRGQADERSGPDLD